MESHQASELLLSVLSYLVGLTARKQVQAGDFPEIGSDRHHAQASACRPQNGSTRRIASEGRLAQL